MSSENPRQGDVFMLKDLEYSKKDGDIPDESVRTIKFDRPCIVLKVQKDIANVIPLTTHFNRHSYVYKLQIQNDKVSGALLTQAMTVEISRLNNYIGKMKPAVFENIKLEYFNYIAGNSNKKKPTRTIPRLFNHLDLYRFFSFHIYLNKITQEMFLCIKTLKDHFYFIPVLRYRCRNLEISTVCGFVDIDNIRIISDKDYNDDYIDIGEEYRSSQRNTIQKELWIKKGLKIYTKLYIDIASDISWSIHELFGQVQYLPVIKAVYSVINDPNKQDEFLMNPKTLLPESRTNQNYKIDDLRFKLIEEYIMNYIDPLTCSFKLLKKIKRDHRDLFELLISPFRDCIYLDPSSKRLFDGELLYNQYKIDNIKFIGEFIRATNRY